MIYLLAIILPPLALLLYGRVIQAIVNLVMRVASALIFILTLGVLGGLSAARWLVCVVHAILVVNRVQNDRRNRALIDAIERSGR